jgi:acyl-coenzyme A thioesterase PaaI-like protein
MDNRIAKSVRQLTVALLVAAGMVSGAANAAFIDQGGGVVLDTTTNLEWEQNANHGPFNWAGAVAYGTTLALDGGGWHLASIDELAGLYANLIAAGVCTGVNCTGSIGGFADIQSSVYWSGTETVPGAEAWLFHFDIGFQSFELQSSINFAWAVRPGDVAAAPEPASLLLIGVGMLGLGWSWRRGRRR